MVINNLLPDAEVTTYGIDGIMTTVYRSAAAALLGSHRTETLGSQRSQAAASTVRLLIDDCKFLI